MPEYTSKLYGFLAQNDPEFAKKLSESQFTSKLSTDSNYSKKMYDFLAQSDPEFSKKLDYNQFQVKTNLKKKAPTQVSKPSVGSSGTTETPQKQSSDSSRPDGIYKYQGNLKANYKKEDGEWYIDPTGGTKFQPLKQGDVAKRVKVLESQAKYDLDLTTYNMPDKVKNNSISLPGANKTIGVLNDKYKQDQINRSKAKVFTGFPGSEENKYILIDGIWQRSVPNEKGEYSDWTTITNEGSIKALNGKFKQNASLDVSKTKEEYRKIGFKDINSNLIGGDEADAVPMLNERYGNLGFKFEEGLGDQMIVTSSIPGVKPLTVNMDSWDSEKDANSAAILKAYLSQNALTKEREKEVSFTEQYQNIALSKTGNLKADEAQRRADLEAGKLNLPELDFQQDLNQQKKNELIQRLENKTGLSMREIQDERARKAKIYSEDKVFKGDLTAKAIAAQNKVNKVYVNNEIKDINLRNKLSLRLSNQFDNDLADFKANYDTYTEEEKAIKESELSQKAAELKQVYDQTKKDSSHINYLIQSQAKSAISNRIVAEKTGTVAGAISRSLTDAIIDSGTGIYQGLGGLLFDTSPITTKERQDAKDAIAGVFTNTTSEFTASEDRSLMTSTLIALTQMTPAIAAGIATGGATAGAAYFWGMGYSNAYDSMDGLKISDDDKRKLSFSIATATAALESFGLTKITSNKAASNFITKRVAQVLSGLPKEATMEMMNNAIYADMKKIVADKLIKITSKGIIEGGVEVSQSAAETEIKELYDATRDKEVFTEDWGSFGKNALKEFLVGSFAGATVNSMSNLGSTVQQLSDPINFGLSKEIATDEDLQDLFKNDLKSKIIQGEMPIPEAKAKLRAVGEFKALLGKVPSNLLEQNQQKAMTLIEEKQKLQREIEGKEPALVEKEKQRIADIDNEMKQIVEDDATDDVNITARGLDQVPEQFRDRARYRGTSKAGRFGKTTKDYVYTITRDEYNKLQENAVQERSTEEVLPREQDQAGEAGGQREGMGQSIKGEEVTQEGPKGKVKDLIGSRVSLTGFGGVTFEKPLIGEMYVGGQQVIFEESATGKFYELGNVNEISNSNFKDLGIDTKTTEGDIAQSSVVPTENGMLQYNGEEFNVDGKVKMKNNEVDRVILTSPDGARTVTLRGQEAIDAAYLITLNKIQSPEQEAMINDLLEQDEEFKRETENIKFTEAEDVAEEEAVADTEQTDGETTGEVETEEEQRARLEELLSSKPKFQRESNPLNTNFDKPLINSLITNLRSKGEEDAIAVLEAIRDGKSYDGGEFELGEVVDSIIENGLTFGNVVGLLKATTDYYSDLSTREIISKLSSIGDPNIGRIAKETIKFQNTEPIAPEDIEAIRKKIESIDSEVVNAEIPSDLTTKNKIDVKSLRSRFGDELKAAFKGGIIKSMSYFNGIPMTFSISDQLGSGIYINPITGNKFLLNGGLGFNLTKGNKFFAWANVEEKEAKDMLKRATDTYENNKDLFEKLWDEGTLPKGLVPVAIAKMGQDSILSNEALFRVAADIFKNKLPLENRVKALNVLSNILNNNIDRIGKISKDKRSDADKTSFGLSKAAYEFIQENNFKSIDELFDNINNLKPIRARGLVSKLTFVGDVTLESTKNPGNPSKDVSKALVEGLDKSYNKFISAQFINDLIKEEATSNIPDQHIIAVVGVDVINPSIGTPNHRNYSAGVKGELIGILENPVHAADVFPGFYARTFTMIKPDKGGKIPSMKQSIGQAVAVGGSIVNMKSLVGARVTSNMTDIQKLLAKLKLAFPSVTISDTVEEFNKALEDPSVKAFTRDGDIIYGFTKGNKVFLNPAIATENTAIHEFAHIWMGFLRQNNPKLLQKGFDLAKKSELYKRKLAENNGDVDLAAEETLAELIASKGEAIFLAAKDASNFKDWLNAMYTYIKTKIPGFKNLTPKQFENLTLEEFVDNSLNSLLSGKEVTQKEVKSIKVLFSKANMTAEEVIRVGRANRISDAVIDRYLQDNGFTGYEALLSASKPQAKPRTELKDLENKIRLYARAKRETKQEIVSVIRNITDTIKGMITKGQMDRANFKYIMTKLSRVNFSKQDSVDAFISYVFKKMTDAEYTDKLKKIQTINKRIKSNSSMVEPIASTAKEFAKINPALVSNIDTHLALAEEINKSLTRYTKETDPTGIKFRENFDYNTLYNYVENNKNNILKKSKKELSEIYDAIFGEGESDGMSDTEMSDKIKEAKENEIKKLKGLVQQKISSLKAIVENDPTVSDLVKRAANVDVDYLNLSDAVDIVNALTMYIDNGFETGLNKLVANYEGAKAIADSKLQFAQVGLIKPGRGISRMYNDKFAYIEMMLNKKSKKVGDVLRFMKESALGLIQRGYNRSEYETNEIRDQYKNKFKKVKKFFDPENKAERALLSYVQRNVSNDDGKAAEFLRRKELVLESIDQLRLAAGRVNLAIADLQEEAAKKLGILKPDGTVNESITIDQINSKAEKSNLEAVKWMQDIWAKKYSELYDHALGMHNTLIGRDEFYTPDRYSSIDRSIPSDVNQMEFVNFTGMTPNKSGVLIEAKRPGALNKKFISMDFEDNNFGSYSAAMNDLYTAEARTKYSAYQSSTKFDDIMGRDKYRQSKDAELIRDAYLRYITAKENKGPVDKETDRKIKKLLNKVSTLSGAAGLASFKNVLAQTATTYFDTIFSVGPRSVTTIFKDSFDPKVWAFIAKADSQVANRGVDAIKFTEKIKEEVMKRSKAAEAAGTVFNAPVWMAEQMIKYTNQKGDKLAAVGAWMTYYREYCRKNGISIDYDTVNEDAAQYAETKTKIQILPSDPAERGAIGANNSLSAAAIRQMLFGFSSFSINQKNRIYADITKIIRGDFKLKVESFKDLIGAISGLAAFQTINVLWKYYVIQGAIGLFLDDEDEEALKKAFESALKLSATQSITDLFSPIPLLDPFMVDGANFILGDGEKNMFAPSEDKWLIKLAEINQAREDQGKPELNEDQEAKRREQFFKDEEFKFYVDEDIKYLDRFGVYGIAAQKTLELKDIIKSATTGVYEDNYQGNITEKTLTKEGKEKMKSLALVKAVGLITGATDLSNISQKLYYKVGKKQSLTDNQVKNTDEVKEWAEEAGYEFDKYAEQIIKIKKSAKEVERAIMYMEDLSPKEKEEYIKTLKTD